MRCKESEAVKKKIKGFFDAITLEEMHSRERGSIRLPTVSVKQSKSDMYKTLIPLAKESRRVNKGAKKRGQKKKVSAKSVQH